MEDTCKHRFTSVEIIQGAVDLRREGTSKLLEIAWEIFDKLGGVNSDDNFIEIWAERKEKRIAKAKEYREFRKPLGRPRKSTKPKSDHPWRKLMYVLKPKE